ncbi:hypothetical protein QFC19_004534 [Naganishia cerealis]|uniref:Uncharacterized protein n=1 Tax=Naganishia cerealis TaxID=610337 RepID=A0ACC2VX29_9TREE|nr:hypothetical protein QFC19_004534 [Naganishia cerealis]
MLAIAIAESEATANRPKIAPNENQTRSNGARSAKGKQVVREVIVVDDSETDDDVAEVNHMPQPNVRQNRKPHEKPLQIQPSAVSQSSAVSNQTPSNTEMLQPTTADSSSTRSPFLVDRAAMERERLERQKRLRGDVNAPASSSSDEEAEEQEQEQEQERGGKSESRGVKRRKLDESSEKVVARTTAVANSRMRENAEQGSPVTNQSLPQSGEELFLKGEVRPTWNEYAHDDRKRFRIQDVVGKKDDLALVITASFCHEPEWITQHFPDPTLVPTIHIRQPPSAAENEKWTMETAETGGGLPGSAAVWCFMPNPGGYGSMHMKFMLLFYNTGRLRVVISSANMVSYDWLEIENIVFVQDLLPTADKSANLTTVSHDWPAKFQRLFDRYMKIEKAIKHLKQFHPLGSQIPLDVLKVGQRSLATLGMWEWSQVTAELVMSVPGKEIGEVNVAKTGKTGMASCLERRGWVPGSGQELVAEFQVFGNYRL